MRRENVDGAGAGWWRGAGEAGGAGADQRVGVVRLKPPGDGLPLVGVAGQRDHRWAQHRFRQPTSHGQTGGNEQHSGSAAKGSGLNSVAHSRSVIITPRIGSRKCERFCAAASRHGEKIRFSSGGGCAAEARVAGTPAAECVLAAEREGRAERDGRTGRAMGEGSGKGEGDGRGRMGEGASGDSRQGARRSRCGAALPGLGHGPARQPRLGRQAPAHPGGLNTRDHPHRRA